MENVFLRHNLGRCHRWWIGVIFLVAHQTWKSQSENSHSGFLAEERSDQGWNLQEVQALVSATEWVPGTKHPFGD